MASEGDSSWVFAALGTGGAAFVAAIYQFFKGRKDVARLDHTVIVEAAELADMADVRLLAKQFGPALEKLTRIDHTTTETNRNIRRLLDKMEDMEEAAVRAKLVREEVARALKEDRQHRDDRERDA
jgi:hypothetical protein